MRDARCVSLIPRTTLHSDSEHLVRMYGVGLHLKLIEFDCNGQNYQIFEPVRCHTILSSANVETFLSSFYRTVICMILPTHPADSIQSLLRCWNWFLLLLWWRPFKIKNEVERLYNRICWAYFPPSLNLAGQYL
jgi:hypothetical protein